MLNGELYTQAPLLCCYIATRNLVEKDQHKKEKTLQNSYFFTSSSFQPISTTSPDEWSKHVAKQSVEKYRKISF